MNSFTRYNEFQRNIFQLIPWISSIVWYSTAVPLFTVLAFSAVKDAYDDIVRIN